MVTVDPAKQKAFEALFAGTKANQVGVVTESTLFRVRDREDSLIIEEEVSELKACWNRPFGGLI